jgi:uncharacterized protein YegP (UPF0339 family)
MVLIFKNFLSFTVIPSLLLAREGGDDMHDKWEFYKDSAGYWRWRRKAPNGEIVGASTESYINKSDCEANARRNGWDG